MNQVKTVKLTRLLDDQPDLATSIIARYGLERRSLDAWYAIIIEAQPGDHPFYIRDVTTIILTRGKPSLPRIAGVGVAIKNPSDTPTAARGIAVALSRAAQNAAG